MNPANPNQRHNFIITGRRGGGLSQPDFIANYDDVKDIIPQQEPFARRGCCSDFCNYVRVINPSYWVFLVILGVLTALLAFAIDIASFQFRFFVSDLCTFHLPWWLGYFSWVLFTIFFAMIAASVGVCISRDAEGSGIPEVKSILAGVNIYKYLSFQTVIGKVIGLFAALVAGLSIGKEGPFVHLATGVANKLAKLRCFRKIETNPAIKKQMLAAAVAAGVASTFGAPMGGVLFSIEVTATYYMVSNLWKAFFCATWSVVTIKLVQGSSTAELFVRTEVANIELRWHLLGYIALGLLSGAVGGLFVTVVGKIIYLRKKIQVAFFSNRWGYVGFVAFVTGFCTFPIIFLHDPDKPTIHELFQPEFLAQQRSEKWSTPAEGFNLFTFAFLKFVLTVLAVTSPIPAGVFTPIFTLGASVGRLFGFTLFHIFEAASFPPNYIALYAVIGAAGVASSVTRTISVCVIVFELTGQVTFLIPLLMCVLTSYAISNSLSISFFDLLLDMKNLPYIPALKSQQAYSLDASDIMNKNFLYLTRDSTLSDIAILLQYVGNQPKSVPVVESSEQKLLCFAVQAQSLRKYLFAEYNKIQARLDPSTRAALSSYFKTLTAISQRDNWMMTQSFALKSAMLKSPGGHRGRFFSQESMGDSLQMMSELASSSSPRARGGGAPPSPRQTEVVDDFWNGEIDYASAVIEMDRAPFTVFEQTPMAKIHFLFTMLNLVQLIVVSKGLAVGIISKGEFLRNKQLQQQDRQGEGAPLSASHAA